VLMRAPAGMISLHSGHEKEDEASGRTVSTQRAHSSWLPSQGMILGSRSPSSKDSKQTGHSRALVFAGGSGSSASGLFPVLRASETRSRTLIRFGIELFACKFFIRLSHHPLQPSQTSSPSERVLGTCGDRGERSRPARRCNFERGATGTSVSTDAHLRPTEGHTPAQGNARVSACTYSPTPFQAICSGVHLLSHPLYHGNGGERGGTATKLTDD
jgi:hypothetical protein